MALKVFRPGQRGSAALFGPLEAVVMDVVWAREHAVTVGDVADALARRKPTLAYSTIKTILTNLVDKGYLSKRSIGRANEFAAKKSKAEFQGEVIGGVVNSLLRDYRNPLLSHLAAELADDPGSIAEFERLLAQRRKSRSRDA
ncbi:MAG: BlaI/MecI/CopY family transcriptional regulator [Candidatus Eremiobacteraeota bacterium]|nr:BlaI/MecI/CopY family transcriptional regulator [Candidatus Eremiobacteraeota bacterium]